MSSKEIQCTSHEYKDFPQKNLTWKEIIEYTKHGKAKYKPGINIENVERLAWEHGTCIAKKDWKVMKFDSIIGAKSGLETSCIRVERSANTIHGHPITYLQYKGYLK